MMKFVAAAVLCAGYILTFGHVCVLAQEVDAVIHKAPQNQYILEGTNATLTCLYNGSDSYWIISGDALTQNNDEQESYYETLGVVFIPKQPVEITNNNLTMIVPSNLSGIVNDIMCVVRDQKRRQVHSDGVNIFVFKTFRPNPPAVRVNVTYHPSMLPRVTAVVTGQPLWNGYNITEHRVNITNGSDGSLLGQMTLPNDSNRNNSVIVNISQSLFESTTQHCYSLIVSGSSVSSEYDGVSKSAQFRAAMLRVPGEFSDRAVNHSTLFRTDGSLSHVSVQVQLPDVCDYQPLNYTIIIEEKVDDITSEVLRSGPHRHEGSGVVFQDFSGLEKDNTYFVKVIVDTITGSVESNSHLLSTGADFDSFTVSNFGTKSTDDVSVYLMAMGIAIGVAVVMITAFGILLVCICVHCQRLKVGDHSRNRVYNNTSMVPNPIYGGPVYDVVVPQFDACSYAKDSSTPTTPLSPDNLDMTNLDGENSHLNNSRNKQLLANVYAFADDVVPPATNKRTLDKNGQERNDFQLSLSSEQGRQRDAETKGDETYVEMNRNSGLRSQPNYNQATPV